MTATSVAVSAPGKVLFAGGFLVLDRKHTGLVFGLNARIHVHIQPWTPPASIPSPPVNHKHFILVRSPQFRDARWLYTVDPSKPGDDRAINITQMTNSDTYSRSGNKFVEFTLAYTLTYLLHLSKNVNKSLQITILADDDYYSQTSATSQSISKSGFTDFGVALSDAHKTGLGSSAALVTSLVSALLAYYLGVDNQLPHQSIHNLAQASHCAAQGKVGSGFDVAAAVYGSCLYKRFSPAILEAVGDAGSAGFGERLHLCVDDLNPHQKWDTEVSSQAVQIPDSLTLIMCDVDCGTETPSMVRKLLQWRKDKPAEAKLLWAALQRGTDDLCVQLRSATQQQDIAQDDFQELADIIQTIRSLVREMSQKSEVPVEPGVITKLLDFCTSWPGVIGGVAPGAGGYDAVALLLRNRPSLVQELEEQLQGWTGKNDGEGSQIGRVRLLGVKQDKEGIRLEDPGRYHEWI